jgi:hypothetical protein
MAYKGKPQTFYAERAKDLQQNFTARISFTVRDAAEVWGLSSTAAALNTIHNLVKYGFVEEEWTGEKKRYYLKNGS